MNSKTRQKGVIPLAIIAVGFLVASLVGVVVTTSDEASNFSLSSWAKGPKKVKTWRDISNPRARNAAKQATEADNAQAQAVDKVCPGGCTAAQLQAAGIEVSSGENPSGFYFNEQSNSYYPIAASAGGGYGASELLDLAPQEETAPATSDTESDPVAGSAGAANSGSSGTGNLSDPAHYGDEESTSTQNTGGGISTQTNSGAGVSTDTYGGIVDTGLGLVNFGAVTSSDGNTSAGITIDPIIGPNTNIGVNIDDNQVSYGVQNPIIDTAEDTAQTAALITVQGIFSPVVNTYNAAVDAYNTYISIDNAINQVNNLYNTADMLIDGASNILSNIFGN
jgi:hypothetical protein